MSAEGLEIADVQCCAALVDWHDMVNHGCSHHTTILMAFFAERILLQLQATELAPSGALVELHIAVAYSFIGLPLLNPRSGRGFFQCRHDVSI